MENAQHTIKLLDFSRLEITGVKEVVGFDEMRIELSLGDTALILGGESLKIESFSRENGFILVVGKIDSLFTEDEISRQPPHRGLLSRIFS